MVRVSLWLFANSLPLGKPYPEFQLGVTGIYVTVKNNICRDTKVLKNSPASSQIKVIEGLKCIWTISGARWGNIGLVKVADRLGPRAGPVIATLKKLKPMLQAKIKTKGKYTKDYIKSVKLIDEAIKIFESKVAKK